MTIKHSKKIESLDVKNTPDNIVVEVLVKFTSFEESNPENTTIISPQRFILSTDGISPESQGFIPFEELSEEIVFGWISDDISKSNILENHESWINSVMNPLPPQIVSRNVPW